MGDFGLDPEMALKLVQILLRGAAYFFAGFALVALSTYVVFLCLEIFASRRRTKVRIAEVPQPAGRASVVERTQEVVLVETPILAKGAAVTGGMVLCED
jgi:hypothetical protein